MPAMPRRAGLALLAVALPACLLAGEAFAGILSAQSAALPRSAAQRGASRRSCCGVAISGRTSLLETGGQFSA